MTARGAKKKLGKVELESWGTGWSSKNLKDGSQIAIRVDRRKTFNIPNPAQAMPSLPDHQFVPFEDDT